MSHKAERFLEYLLQTTGREPDLVVAVESDTAGMGMVYGITYFDYPEKELTTGFTYGLSESNHSEWKAAKPELSITTVSSSTDWTQALAYLVEWNRETHAFLPGSLFHYGKPVSPDSAMDAFLVFNPAIGNGDEFRSIQLADDTISILGVHPLYYGEVAMLQKVGIRKFMDLPEYRLFSVTRPDLSKLYKLNQ
jgi:hypothetical protein